MSETQRPIVYEPGTLRPSWLPESSSTRRLTAPAGASPGERRAKAEALESARSAWLRRRGPLEGDLAAARAASARIRPQLAAAASSERTCEIALAQGTAEHDAAVIAHETFLRETASPLIDEVLVWLRDQFDGLGRRGMLQTTERSGPRNVATGHRPSQTYSNLESIELRRRAILAALKTWEGYRLAPLDETELRARATALLTSLPATEATVAAPLEPLVSPGEERELRWRLEQEARR